MQTRTLLAGIIATGFVSGASAANLVTNASFETNDGGNVPTVLTDWTIDGQGGGGLIENFGGSPAAPDGTYWAYLLGDNTDGLGGTLSQMIGSGAVLNGDVYSFSVAYAEQGGNGPVSGTIAIFAGDPNGGGTLLDSAVIGPTLDADPAGTVYTATGSLSVGAGFDGADLYVHLTNTTNLSTNRNLLLDTVSVELVPEPGSLALLGLGGLALLRRRRA